MPLTEILDVLGSKRVIWIDDCFNNSPSQLARLLVLNLETALSCEFNELQDALVSAEYGIEAAEEKVAQILTDLGADRVLAIKQMFFEKEREKEEFATRELSDEAIDRACTLLGVAPEDRWTFDKAEAELGSICEAGDASLSYIVDLNEAGGPKARGLSILEFLWQKQSLGTAFILTHDTDAAGESKREDELRSELADSNAIGIPICVIAKERIHDSDRNAPDSIVDALKVGLKRAGLRRSVYEVLLQAQGEIQNAFDEAAGMLLRIPPEKLESHVFERGYREGVSELHVVERAISAHIGQQIRSFFGSNGHVLASTKRLRALRNIKLDSVSDGPDPNLSAFREAEVWESDLLLNRAFTPIACGDVFEVDRGEESTKNITRRFVLLGQPCDISLRPEEKVRSQDTAFLIPLKKRTEDARRDDPKAPFLPFRLNDEHWSCDLRNVSLARLSILDLASFRVDGRVRVDEGHSAPEDLLIGQQNVYANRTAAASEILNGTKTLAGAGTVTLALQLTFSSVDAFKHIHTAKLENRCRQQSGETSIDCPKRVTWFLRRCGRIRMPYATVLLDQYSAVITRPAFDLDYMVSSRTPPSSADDLRSA